MVEKIKITFLGTGSAIPTARRNHPATLLQYKAENILVDCGEGTQRQFRKAYLNPCKITKILISHWHGDHVLGLPGLLQTMMLNEYSKKLEIYGPKGTKQKIRAHLDLFIHKGSKLDLIVKEVNNGVIFPQRDDPAGPDENDFYIEAMKMEHNCPAVAYSFVVKKKLRIDKEKLKKLKIKNSPLIAELAKGKVIEIDGKKIDGNKLLYKEDARKVTFVMDTRYNENAVKLAKDADVLICEATYSASEENMAEEYGHLTSADAAKIAKKAKVKGLALVHLSQRYDATPKVILKEAQTVFDSVVIPEDLESVEL